MNILVTGGAGYIGSHVTELLLENNQVIVYDKLEKGKGHKEAIPKKAVFVRGNISDVEKLDETFKKYNIDSVVHLAAYSELEESMKKPREYLENNLTNTAILVWTMLENKIKNIVFSSSAAVYGNPTKTPITEEHPIKPVNLYGLTKSLAEKTIGVYHKDLNSISLRYFNVAGASKNLGEDHRPETHLIPLVLKTALGKNETIKIFGTDYNTKDGTCIRDYIHVLDIAQAHVLALESLSKNKSRTYNIGSETGYSVKEVIDTAKKITKKEISIKEKGRREGDPPILVASSEKIKRELGWEPKFSDLTTIIQTAWDWHLAHPDGY